MAKKEAYFSIKKLNKLKQPEETGEKFNQNVFMEPSLSSKLKLSFDFFPKNSTRVTLQRRKCLLEGRLSLTIKRFSA